MARKVAVVTLCFVTAVSAFSAQLSRPWDPPLSSVNRLTRRQRWGKSGLYIASGASTQDKDELDESSTYQNNKEEDNNVLQGSDGSSGHKVIINHRSEPNAIQASSSDETSTDRSTWRLLFEMTRPSNFPGVVLLHVLGTYLALKSPYVTNAQLVSTLLRPSMMVVLGCLLLTSAASMMVNDYFDNQIGVDKDLKKPLVGGSVSMADTKKCLYFMYQAIAIAIAFVPGALTRLMVVVGNINTYWYTKHLKPITWVKNAVCASVMALSPATSGAAAFHLLSPTQNSFLVFGVADLTRLVLTLFLGFVGREILMDINDVDNDAACNIQTVPVVYGKRFASTAALVSTAAMALCATMGPLWRLAQSLGGNLSWRTVPSTLRSNPGGSTRQLVFACLGCLPMLRRAFDAYQTEGQDRPIVEKAVNEGKITFMFILASFV